MLGDMQVRFHDDPTDFAAVAVPLYARDPVLNTVELSLLGGAALQADGSPLLLSVWDGADPVGAALQTPPQPMLCTGLPQHVVADVVDAVTRVRPELPGVRGTPDVVAEFARLWQLRTGSAAVDEMGELLYRLGVPRWPQVTGASRQATEADHDLLVAWLCEFAEEAFRVAPDPSRAEATIAATAAAGSAFVLWTVDDAVVSMAGVRSPACGVSRIGPVYTPVSLRGNGYGSAATAAAARWAQSAAADQVVLTADVANPVSNAIYRRMGFEPVERFQRIDFTVK